MTSHKAKDYVSYDPEIKKLLALPKVVAQINVFFQQSPPDLSTYDNVADDLTCVRVYDALKGGRFDAKGDLRVDPDNLVNESNMFASWIQEGRREKLNSNPKDDLTVYPTNDNILKYNHTYRLFTNCDDFNMKNVTNNPNLAGKQIPLHAATSDDYKTLVAKSRRIYDAVRRRTMPLNGEPWTDDEINFYTAWLFDGCQGAAISNPGDCYMQPTFPANVTINKYDEPVNPPPNLLNFNQHIKPIFADGHREAMMFHRGFNLQEYKDVNKMKVDIFGRLTQAGGQRALMPQSNPWPRKNVLLFYFWAKQGPNSREGPESGDPAPYNDTDKDFVDIQTSYKDYIENLILGNRKPNYIFYEKPIR